MGILFFILMNVLPTVFFWRIFAKAGYQPAWALVALIPFAFLFLLGFLALADWPARSGPSPRTFD